MTKKTSPVLVMIIMLISMEEGAREPGLYDGVVDLSIAPASAPLPTFDYNERVGGRDYRGDIYAKLCQASHDAYYSK